MKTPSRYMTALLLAPVAAFGPLFLVIAALVVLSGRTFAEGVLASWFIGVNYLVFGLPVAYATEWLLVIVARSFGHAPENAGLRSTLFWSTVTGMTTGAIV